jgi:hypothetical protein
MGYRFDGKVIEQAPKSRLVRRQNQKEAHAERLSETCRSKRLGWLIEGFMQARAKRRSVCGSF